MSCLLNVCKLETLTVGNAFNSLILCQQNKWEGGFQLKWEGGAGGGGMVKQLAKFKIVGRYFLNTIRCKNYEKTQLDAFLPSTLGKKRMSKIVEACNCIKNKQ